jgi:hypothetical protein
MADLDGDLSIGGDIDIDRVIIDPDYRRVVIALLRQSQSPAEIPAPAAAPLPDQPEDG